MDNFMQLLNELEQVVSGAKKSVFSSNDAIVNRAQMLEIIDRMREAYPDVMRQAQFIVEECDNQKQRALEYGNRIIQEAEARRNKLLDESDILKQATAEAESVRKEAYEMRARVEYDAKCKIDEVLSDSEVTLRDALTLIRNNREELRQTGANAPQQTSESLQYQNNGSDIR